MPTRSRSARTLKVIFPFSDSDREIVAKVDYIDKAIDPDTRSAKFRTTIPNPGGRVKAGTFVKVQVQIPPKAGRTVIPRTAMVSVDRYRLRLRPQAGKADTFERRPIIAAKESNDIVVVAEPAEGHRELKPGEEVVTTGSLILEQMYEDKLMAEGGLLVSEPAQGKARSFPPARTWSSPPPGDPSTSARLRFSAHSGEIDVLRGAFGPHAIDATPLQHEGVLLRPAEDHEVRRLAGCEARLGDGRAAGRGCSSPRPGLAAASSRWPASRFCTPISSPWFEPAR